MTRPRRQKIYPRLEVLEDRWIPSVVPWMELTEGNAAAWQTFASDGAFAQVVNDTTKVGQGSQSLRFDTQSGFDTGIRLGAGAENWDVSGFKQLAFWTFAVNDTPYGFQGEQPVVVLTSSTGSYRYTPVEQGMLHHGWQKHHIPLAGDASWLRETIGVPDLANVTSLEVHQDTWDYGFTIYYDGMQFSTRDVAAPPVPGPTPPPGITTGTVTPRVLLYVFDPIMENLGGVRLHAAYGWQDPVELTQQSMADLEASSHGMYRPRITQTVIADQQPFFTDGFQHTDASFVTAWANRDFHAGFMFDYNRFIQENDLAARVDRGEVDEVWIYAPPISGLWESSMAGRDAYWINGPTQPAGERAFPIMGLNYERGVGEAIHSFGHRAESSIDHAYETLWQDPNHAWRRFTRINRDAPGQGGVGNVHYPVNGLSDYDYANNSPVVSHAPDWYHYPDLTGRTEVVSRTTWSPGNEDPHREYLNWWYDHLPHAAGRGPDLRLNNWWRYIGDPDSFKHAGRSLFRTDGTGRVVLSGMTPGQTLTGAVTLRADTLLDGVAGRVDLYVDGTYHSSDDLGPFTFTLDAQQLTQGSHTVQLRAYEVQYQTESVSLPLSFQVDRGTNENHAPVLQNSAVTLSSINEDSTGLVVAVQQLVQAALVTDTDAAAQKGIAIVAASAGGAWHYSTNAGVTWLPLQGLSASSARLLAAATGTLVRFVPARDFSGTAGLTFKAWDQTEGVNGGTAPVAPSGASTAFSTTSATATLLVLAINDAPAPIQNSVFLPNIIEDDINNQGELVSRLANPATVADPDAGTRYGMAVTAASTKNGLWQYSLNNGATWSNVGARSTKSALLLPAEPDVRVRFVPHKNLSVQATLSYRAWDRTVGTSGSHVDTTLAGGTAAFSTTLVTAHQLVVAQNDAPVLTIGQRTINLPKNGTVIFTGSKTIKLTDVDAGTGIVRVTITLREGTGTLSLSSGAGLKGLAGNKTARLTLDGSVTAINSALRRMTFKPKSGFKGPIHVDIQADDRGLTGSGGARTTSDVIRILVG